MRTFVRLGGLTDAAGVAAVPDGGAAGFLFDRPASPRNLDAEAIAGLLEALPSNVEAWGQVVDPSVETIRTLFETVGVDRIEVHGRVPEGLEYLEIHHLVPAVPLPPEGADGPDPAVPPAEHYPRLLLVGPGSPIDDGEAGRGSWPVGQRVVDGQPGRKLTLSGGLSAGNVAEALAAVRPYGIAVGAAVERAPGHPDPEKLAAFLAAIESAEP